MPPPDSTAFKRASCTGFIHGLGRISGRSVVGREPVAASLEAEQQAPIIIAGFGRYGQIIGRLLYANGLEATVLDHAAVAIDSLRKFGWPVFFGDASRLDLLRTAGAAKARVLVIAVDDMIQSVAIAAEAQQQRQQQQPGWGKTD